MHDSLRKRERNFIFQTIYFRYDIARYLILHPFETDTVCGQTTDMLVEMNNRFGFKAYNINIDRAVQEIYTNVYK